MKELPAIVAQLHESSTFPAALATLVHVSGSSYRRPGARLLLSCQGKKWGSISGGCLEEDVLLHAQTVIQNGIPKTITYDTTEENDLVWGVGLGCHGVVQVFIERLEGLPDWAKAWRLHQASREDTTLTIPYRSDRLDEQKTTRLPTALPPREGVFVQSIPPVLALTIFGAGDDAVPLARLAKELGWFVSVLDPRPAFATADRFPSADVVRVQSTGLEPTSLVTGPHAAAVVMTHHYVHDLPLLRSLLPLPLFYLGLLGPKKRAEKLLDQIASEPAGLPAEQRARLYGPVGLDLGGDSPESVALAILAEIQSVYTGRDARPLRARARPIHQ
ncbi:MAG TPA: XdhC family protein [Opitutaceae bacterium]|nr:XdhC family protein [Opitutaceae bacterium]